MYGSCTASSWLVVDVVGSGIDRNKRWISGAAISRRRSDGTVPTKVVGFQIVVRSERMNDPHLVTSAASGDVETLFEKFLIS